MHDGATPRDLEGVLSCLSVLLEYAGVNLLPDLHKRVEEAVFTCVHLCQAAYASTPAFVRLEQLGTDFFDELLLKASVADDVFKTQSPTVQVALEQPCARPSGSKSQKGSWSSSHKWHNNFRSSLLPEVLVTPVVDRATVLARLPEDGPGHWGPNSAASRN